MLTRRVFGMRMAAAIAGLATMIVATVPAARADDKVVVFAAASLKNALDSVNAAWKAETGKEATISYASEFGACQADRGGRPGRHFHLGRSRLDEIPFRQEADSSRTPR